MRRAPILIAATAGGVALVLGYQPHARPLPSAGTQAPVATAPAPTRSVPTGATPTRPAPPRQVTGADVPNQYGDVQVRVSAAGGRITQVAAVVLPSDAGRSQEISSFAGPQLAQQALAAQSAKIDGVSGATYTSDSYRSSLQSAIDRLGASVRSR